MPGPGYPPQSSEERSSECVRPVSKNRRLKPSKECVIKETPRRMLLVLIDLGIYPPRGGYTPFGYGPRETDAYAIAQAETERTTFLSVRAS